MSSDYTKPGNLDLHNPNLGETYTRWQRDLRIYMKACGALKKAKDVQTAIILNCAGPEVVDLYETFTFEAELDKDDPEKVLLKFKEYCMPRENEILQTYRFWKLQYADPFDSFVSEVQKQSRKCNFLDNDRMIRDKIVFSVPTRMQELLLKEARLSVDKAIEICRNFELLERNKKEMTTPVDHVKIDRKTGAYSSSNEKIPPRRANDHQQQRHGNWKTDIPRKYGSQQNRPLQDRPKMDDRRPIRMYDDKPRLIECRFCGRRHEASKLQCPAWGKWCQSCGQQNHISRMCRKGVNQMSRNAENDDYADDVDDTAHDHYEYRDVYSDDDESVWFDADETNTNAVIGQINRRVTARMKINDSDVIFQLDTGADVSTITQRHVKREQVIPTNQTLTVWNGQQVKPVGEAKLKVTNPKTQEEYTIVFVVVPNDFSCLLGITAVQEMNLLTIHQEKFIRTVDHTEDLGNIGIARLYTDDSVKPKTLPCRNIPIAIKEQVKTELETMERRGIICKEEEPTPWVSQMAVVKKPNGKLRICIDPQPLNEALMREHYKLPTLDDILPSLNNAKIFTKLDVKEAFWHVELDEESSRLTTMITPFARYRWKRLPFGLKVSSEIFQKRLIAALIGLEGVICVADDIIVVGCGNTANEVLKDHDLKLKKLKERCTEKGIRLNEEKAVYKSEAITFMGHKITKDGIKVDENKIKAITEMPVPKNAEDVKRFCGMAQYLARFLPELANDTEPMRALTRKDYVWEWSDECQESFERVKTKITKAPILSYYNPRKDLFLQVDSSQSGIGCALLQEEKPIEYASRALTTAERNWAQIEKELLSVVYGLERFDQYTFGRKVIVENDHRPLFSILRKPLSQSPKRLQVLILRLRRYDVDFQYKAGSQLYIADTLSRAYIKSNESQVRVVQDEIYDDVPDKIIAEIADAVLADRVMKQLRDQILQGWPDTKGEVHEDIRGYYDVRDTLSFDRGVIRKGERVVIPESLRGVMKQRLHKAHTGHDGMMRRARQTMYWPGMDKDLKHVVDSCGICHKYNANPQKEPLVIHDDGSMPWCKVGSDIFEYNHKSYLILVDYYSGFIEVDYLPSISSQGVINILKRHFGRYGIPSVLMTDNGPQYSSLLFKLFVKDWHINHKTSSPMYPKSNGKAEASVKIAKTLIKKVHEDGGDIELALLELRNTPRQDTGASPAQLMFGRATRSILPQVGRTDGYENETRLKKDKRNETVKNYYDKTAKHQPALNVGDSVYFKHRPLDAWQRGIVRDKHDPRSYVIEGKDKVLYRRNRVHMKPADGNAMRQTNEQKQPTARWQNSRDCRSDPRTLARYPQSSTSRGTGNTTPPYPQPSTSRGTGNSHYQSNDHGAYLRPRRVIRQPSRYTDY